MNWADRLEQWLGRAWDGRLKGRQGGLQPVKVARALEAELLAGKRVSILHTYAPNRYRVFLHPGDWEEFRPIQRTLTAEMCEYLRDVADRERSAFVSPPQVEWLLDPEAPRGQVRVEAQFLEPQEVLPDPAEEEGMPSEPGPWAERESRSFPKPPLGRAAAGTWEPGAHLEPEADPVPPEGQDEEGLDPWEPSGPPEEAEAFSEERVPTRRYRAVPDPEVQPRGRLVVVEGPDQGSTFLLEEPEIVIGRVTGDGSSEGVLLTDRGVSRRHARLLWRGGLWWLEDLGSTNGTCVNGEWIESGWVQAGDRLEVGNSLLQLEDPEELS